LDPFFGMFGSQTAGLVYRTEGISSPCPSKSEKPGQPTFGGRAKARGVAAAAASRAQRSGAGVRVGGGSDTGVYTGGVSWQGLPSSTEGAASRWSSSMSPRRRATSVRRSSRSCCRRAAVGPSYSRSRRRGENSRGAPRRGAGRDRPEEQGRAGRRSRP
jgi:hypothetical protein